MYRFAAAIIALSVTQQEPAPAATASPAPAAATAKPAEQAPAPAPVTSPPPASAPPIDPSPVVPARPAIPAVAPPAPPPAAQLRPQGAAQLPAPAQAKPTVAPAPPPPSPRPPAARATPPPVLSEREQLIEAALAFVDALLRGDVSDLVAASSARFSFDGTELEGRDAEARRWREILAARGTVAPEELRDLIVMTGPEATAQLGAPPPRLAPLVARGAWIAVADLSGRPVVLFLVREGDRIVVAGMHD